ncbi:TetR/AcrR family transcriptional regulator [Sulfurovum sp.]|uniref:TetR/AcrR family transcriptional regulator n=1 Tax=Sulfurovum sp. TaxID=1969726 RepID=UPI002867FF0B|nr:TetR/AcrR family transcriptional regulator [Sulfurovum sp.]
MAIIINKEEKRRNIALSCRELLLEHGINKLTISQIAKTAGIGKGTIYEYFDNKEDIVFEIITTFIAEHEKKLLALLDVTSTTKEKLFHFFYLLFEDESNRKHLMIYKEFLAISLVNETEKMLVFSEQCRDKFIIILNQILEEGRKSGEVDKEILISASSLVLFTTGLVVDSRLSNFSVKKEIDMFLDMLLPKNEKGR